MKAAKIFPVSLQESLGIGSFFSLAGFNCDNVLTMMIFCGRSELESAHVDGRGTERRITLPFGDSLHKYEVVWCWMFYIMAKL